MLETIHAGEKQLIEEGGAWPGASECATVVSKVYQSVDECSTIVDDAS